MRKQWATVIRISAKVVVYLFRRQQQNMQYNKEMNFTKADN